MRLQLTKSEEAIVELKAKGFLAKEICDKRFVTIHTVNQHIKRAIKRNLVSNGFELVARYASNHPELFRNAIVALFIAIQGLIGFQESRINLKKRRDKKDFKTYTKIWKTKRYYKTYRIC